MAQNIHPTAIVHPHAKIGTDVVIGPYSIVGEHVELGAGTEIQEHVVLRGHTKLGEKVKVFPFATIGGAPQHTQYKGEPTRVEVGDCVTIREGVTIHLGTVFGNEVTRVGSDAYLMGYCHIAHDCVVGEKTIIANAVQFAGHVVAENNVVVGGHSAIAQFCRIGKYCYVGGGSVLRKDLLPFMAGKGGDFQVQGINAVGLSRQGFSPQTISDIRKIYKIFYLRNLKTKEAVQAIEAEVGKTDESKVIADFVKDSKVGFIR